MLDKCETFNYDLYKIDPKPKHTYASQITEEMAIRHLQTLGYQIPDMHYPFKNTSATPALISKIQGQLVNLFDN